MILGIVGHAAEKFDARTEAGARSLIRRAISDGSVTEVVSGRSPMGGVDVWAEEIADELEKPKRIFPPTVPRWDAVGGFKERNLAIAKACDKLLVIVVESLPESYKGMRFKDCYHCKGRVPAHVKSGGCWTGWKALMLGKPVEWLIVE